MSLEQMTEAYQMLYEIETKFTWTYPQRAETAVWSELGILCTTTGKEITPTKFIPSYKPL